MEIGERIRALRTARGLSQEEVARRTGIGLKSYGDLERGRTRDPHYSTLRGVARALDIRVEELLAEPVAVGKAAAEAPPSAEQPPLNGWQEKRRDEAVPGWVTEWLSPDFQRAREELNKYCREWTERQQRGELDLDAIERFFEDAERWSPVVESALNYEARQLILTGQVPLDPHIDPNDLLSAEFLGLLDKLYSTGKLGSAWSRWMDLQNEFLAQAEDLQIDPKMLERMKKVAEESRARFPVRKRERGDLHESA